VTASNVVLEALLEAIRIIEGESLDYCLFGGLAIQAYKRIRSTLDVDLLIAIDEEQKRGFIARLQKKGFKFDEKKGIIRISNFEIIRCVYTEKKHLIEVFVDFVAVTTDFQKQVLGRKQRLNIFASQVNIATCEDLILLKVLSGRPLDLSDVDVLVAENKKSLDKDYLKESAKKLGIERRISYIINRLA
jgi:predicted nucleotidyltransferase